MTVKLLRDTVLPYCVISEPGNEVETPSLVIVIIDISVFGWIYQGHCSLVQPY